MNNMIQALALAGSIGALAAKGAIGSRASKSLKATEPRLAPSPYRNSRRDVAVEIGLEQRECFMAFSKRR
jgi:hypothetical protein